MRPSPDRKLLLMGLRASGKSTLARAAAEAWDVAWADLDDLTLSEAGRETVREVFERDGEAAFRAAEVRALRAALGSAELAVLALGGGTPTAPGAAELLAVERDAGGAVLVYLRVQPGVLADRLRGLRVERDANRPALTAGSDAAAEVERLFFDRDPLYQSLATHTLEDVDTLETALAALDRL